MRGVISRIVTHQECEIREGGWQWAKEAWGWLWLQRGDCKPNIPLMGVSRWSHGVKYVSEWRRIRYSCGRDSVDLLCKCWSLWASRRGDVTSVLKWGERDCLIDPTKGSTFLMTTCLGNIEIVAVLPPCYNSKRLENKCGLVKQSDQTGVEINQAQFISHSVEYQSLYPLCRDQRRVHTVDERRKARGQVGFLEWLPWGLYTYWNKSLTKLY